MIILIFLSLFQLVVGAAGLAAGLLGIAAYVNQQNELKSICTTVSRNKLNQFFGDGYISPCFNLTFKAHLIINLIQAKALGDTTLTRVAATTDIDTDAERMAVLNTIIDKINGYATPDCSS